MEFKKYDKIKALGHEDNKGIFDNPDDDIVVQEKIDGGNFRFMIKEGVPIFGSRTRQLTDDTGKEDNVAKGFQRTIDFVRDKLSKVDLYDDYDVDGFIFFGEACHKHTLSYDWDRIPPFLGFDIFDMKTGKYLDFDIVKEMYDVLGLPMVPWIDTVKAGTINKVDDSLVPISFYMPKANPKQLAEGIVFKNTTKQLYAKYVRAEFKEANAETFGGTPKYGECDTSKIVLKYCTNARIEKAVFKLVDDGNPLDMPLMKLLPVGVYQDIWEEEWSDITSKKVTIDLKKMRKQITRRCLMVLRQIITNNALPEVKEE